MDKPKRCPFCGSGGIRPEYEGDGLREWFVYCPNCAARGPVSYKCHRSDETCIGEAVHLWNRRAK